MNSLKSLVVLAVLGVIGYAVYLGLGGQLDIAGGPPTDAELEEEGWNQADSHGSHAHSDGHDGHNSASMSTAAAPVESATSPAAYRQEIKPSAYSPPATSAASTGPSSAAPSAYAPPSTATNSSVDSSSVAQTPQVDSPADPLGTALSTPSGIAAVDPAAIPEATSPATGLSGPSAYRARPSTTTDVTTATINQTQESQAAPAAYTAGALEPVSNPADDAISQVFESSMKAAHAKIDAGHPEDAFFELSQMYENPHLGTEHRAELIAVLDQVAGTVIYSRQHLMEPEYVVKPNERLEDIARTYVVSAGLLAKINGLDPNAALAPGTKLKVIRGPFRAVIDTKLQELTLFVNSRYAGRFKIYVGSNFNLESDQGRVVSSTRQHSQYDNQVWIGLSSTPPITSETSGPVSAQREIGIVGMSDPQSIGAGPEKQNIGVSVQDAEDLYDILSRESTVTVLR